MSTTTAESVRTTREIIVRELPRWIEEEPTLQRRLVETLKGISPERMTRHKMTYEEFLAWADEDTLAEWVDGEVVMYSPASDRHQDVARFLTSVLGIYVETRGLGVIRPAPFQMKLERGREPDLLFVAREHLDRLLETRLQGPADVVVEIVSQDSIERDRGTKFVEYEAGGVREYWLLDPLREWAEFYQLGETGHYRVVFSGTEGTYHSEAVPGFWLQVEWLWQEPLLHPLRALGEIAGVDSQMIERLLQALGGEG